MRLLIIEDDTMLGDLMARAIGSAGYEVDWVRNAEDGVSSAASQAYDAILLDLGLPSADGMAVLRQIRLCGNDTPVLIVTAQDGLDRKLNGLDGGADDYLVKPFDLDELLARIRVHIRRREGRHSDIIQIGKVSVDLIARQVLNDSTPVALTLKEFRVLAELVRRRGRFVSKNDLEAELYDDASTVESNTVEVAIYALRRKLGADLIITARGLGYMIGGPT
jgi:DNA-binding response OmpR family regulator